MSDSTVYPARKLLYDNQTNIMKIADGTHDFDNLPEISMDYSNARNKVTDATQSAAGLMSAADKQKVDTIGTASNLKTSTKTDLVSSINEIFDYSKVLKEGSGAGLHNSIFRGKSLGTSVTSAQYDAINAGTFDDLWIGDYWTISNVRWRIADFDYWLHCGDTECTVHHVIIVPDQCLYTAKMNDSNVTTGAYVGSAMYTTNIASAKTTITNAFGSTHILNHREILQNAVTSGYPSGYAWLDSTVELMSERMVYGNPIYTPMSNGSTIPIQYTIDKSQLNLFRLRPDLICSTLLSSGARQWYWLRDVVSAADFADVGNNGGAGSGGASHSVGVRPAFAIRKAA